MDFKLYVRMREKWRRSVFRENAIISKLSNIFCSYFETKTSKQVSVFRGEISRSYFFISFRIQTYESALAGPEFSFQISIVQSKTSIVRSVPYALKINSLLDIVLFKIPYMTVKNSSQLIAPSALLKNVAYLTIGNVSPVWALLPTLGSS